MHLKDLKNKGALVTGALVKKELTWTRVDPESGEELSDTFSVFVVKRMSISAYEMIMDKTANNDAMAAAISQCIRLGEEGEEKISFGDARKLDPSLAFLFAGAVNEVHAELKKAREERAGNSQPPTSSGTSSSSPASEAEQ